VLPVLQDKIASVKENRAAGAVKAKPKRQATIAAWGEVRAVLVGCLRSGHGSPQFGGL
jgi:Zn ribbon nucleic-acid-binding protein